MNEQKKKRRKGLYWIPNIILYLAGVGAVLVNGYWVTVIAAVVVFFLANHLFSYDNGMIREDDIANDIIWDRGLASLTLPHAGVTWIVTAIVFLFLKAGTGLIVEYSLLGEVFLLGVVQLIGVAMYRNNSG